LQQPVAVDLRSVVSALRINDDLERIGDLAVNIGEAAQSYVRHAPVKPLIDLPRMGQLALTMLKEGLDAFIAKDVVLSCNVRQREAWAGALPDKIVRELVTFMMGDSRTIDPATDVILAARHLEGGGAHATNIAEDVIFVGEARDIRQGSRGGVTPREPPP